MNILDLLDKDSPEISRALSHGFRKGDSDAVGRAVIEEIKARKQLVKILNDRIRLCENEFPGIKDRLLNIDTTLQDVTIPTTPTVTVQSGEEDQVTDARLDAIDERIGIIASGLVTIVNSLSS